MLSSDWITNGWIDFELKKYQVMAYLQKVRGHFGRTELFPMLQDLVFHFRNLKDLKEKKQLFYDQFSYRITQADWKKLELTYEKIVQDDDLMQELETIVNWALPQMELAVEEGKEIYQEVEHQIEISPVGLMTAYPDEGFAFFWVEGQTTTDIYDYKITLFTDAEERFRGIHLNYLSSVERSVGQSLEQIKWTLLKKRAILSQTPGAYLVYSKKDYPKNETLLPIAKRLLAGYIVKTSGI